MLKPLTGRFFKRWDYETTLPASWETCTHVKKHPLELDMEQWTVSKLQKEYIKTVYCHPVLFNLYAQYIMWNAGLDEAQAWIKIARRNINNLGYADDTILMAENRVSKESLDKGERGVWKSWLKIQHSKN